MSLITRMLAPFRTKAVEGEYREGPYLLSGGWLPAGTSWNFWQAGENLRPYGTGSSMVEACVSAYAQTVAMCATESDHWLLKPNGGREQVTTASSALARILRKPNDYDTTSDFWLNLVTDLFEHGNAYALALRNDRFEIAELHRMRSRECTEIIAQDGAIFYGLSGNEVIESRLSPGLLSAVPARNVLHLRLKTRRHMLRGESPVLAAALDVAAGNAAMRRQINFFLNEARPSIMLSTDAVLTPEKSAQLRESWDARTRGEGAGGTPILTAGLKPIVISSTAVDSQLAETLKMSDQAVALAFRVPLPVLGIGGPVQSSTESLMQLWKASGLGFCLAHVEECLGRLFGLKGVPFEYVEFSTAALLRSEFKDRVEGFARGVQGGIFAPDEARAEFELPKAPGGVGAEPRVQQQVVPLSAWEKGQEAIAAAPPPPAPAAPPAEEEDEPDDAERFAPDAIRRRIDARARSLH